jgi:hypothetical protein
MFHRNVDKTGRRWIGIGRCNEIENNEATGEDRNLFKVRGVQETRM